MFSVGDKLLCINLKVCHPNVFYSTLVLSKAMSRDILLFIKVKAMFRTGFDLMTHDWCFIILVEVFTKHILAGNRSHRVNRAQDYGPKTC